MAVPLFRVEIASAATVGQRRKAEEAGRNCEKQLICVLTPLQRRRQGLIATVIGRTRLQRFNTPDAFGRLMGFQIHRHRIRRMAVSGIGRIENDGQFLSVHLDLQIPKCLDVSP